MKFAYLVRADGYFFRCRADSVSEGLEAHGPEGKKPSVPPKPKLISESVPRRWSIGKDTFTEYTQQDFAKRRIPEIASYTKPFFDFTEWPEHVKVMHFPAS